MNTKREIIGAIALVVIIVLGVLWYMNEHPAPVSQNQTASSTSPVNAQNTGVGGATPISLNQSAPYYDIKASYPSVTPLRQSASASADTEAVATMRQFEEGAISTFKSDGKFDTLSAKDAAFMGITPDNKESLNITYRMTTGTQTISYIYMLTADTLGAHPNTTYKTFTFSSKAGTLLSLADLFPKNSDYLNTLSAAARKALPSIIAAREKVGVGDIGTDILNSGTAPTVDNFSNWYLDGNTLVIIFPPYQVAAYAAGEIELRLPLSSLAGASVPSHVSNFGTLY